MTKKPAQNQALIDGVLSRDRASLARALTLVESTKPEHERESLDLLETLASRRNKSQRSIRIAITGLPGAGKSTLIEALGKEITSHRKTVAVLAIDPSSQLTGGSILGDKTRMVELSQDDRAFIRPSPSSGALGGVSPRTRRSLAVCEAAGFDYVLVETVGVGQSEAKVADMVDLVLLTLIAGAGDELQGIKRGILEMADLILVNKADGDNETAAEQTRLDYENASRITGEKPVLKLSALEKRGVTELRAEIDSQVASREKSGAFVTRRQEQNRLWMWEDWSMQIQRRLLENADFAKRAQELEAQVVAGKISPLRAADALLNHK